MLRLYESRGLLTPARTSGGTRRYSARDIDRIDRITMYLATGLNLAGIERVFVLEAEVDAVLLTDHRGDRVPLLGEAAVLEQGPLHEREAAGEHPVPGAQDRVVGRRDAQALLGPPDLGGEAVGEREVAEPELVGLDDVPLGLLRADAGEEPSQWLACQQSPAEG